MDRMTFICNRQRLRDLWSTTFAPCHPTPRLRQSHLLDGPYAVAERPKDGEGLSVVWWSVLEQGPYAVAGQPKDDEELVVVSWSVFEQGPYVVAEQPKGDEELLVVSWSVLEQGAYAVARPSSMQERQLLLPRSLPSNISAKRFGTPLKYRPMSGSLLPSIGVLPCSPVRIVTMSVGLNGGPVASFPPTRRLQDAQATGSAAFCANVMRRVPTRHLWKMVSSASSMA
ncbi:hypothetical protein PF007_g27868 [Phytophthora fragariae]|uniref:Uncharacterized protein n=2 Tax=Phytophthora fragariae TaxID=53985 RepID=A0A6A3Q2X2_9STRA|nr:hypothetical protein PF007_g27868 [Phytophthora fragariae]